MLSESKLILNFLMNHIFDGYEICLLSNSEISQQVNIGEKEVEVCLNNLKETGYIFIRHLKKPMYRLITPTPIAKELFGGKT